MAAELRWFAVELTAEGKAKGCREVGKPSVGLHCVLAASPEDAIRQVVNAQAAKLLAKRRAEAREKGLCSCGRKRENPNFKHCARCLALHKGYKKRHADKAKGLPVPKLDRRTTLQENKREEQARAVEQAKPSVRLDVLLEVQEAWQDSTNNGLFTRWLNEQIAAARGRKVA